MPLDVKGLEREFRFKHKGTDAPLSDPNPEWSPERVLQFYSNLYPELTTAKISNSEYEGDKIVYEISTTIGTKG